jgi:hypothetical protein
MATGTTPAAPVWRKSRESMANGNCVEVAEVTRASA